MIERKEPPTISTPDVHDVPRAERRARCREMNEARTVS